MIKVILTAPLYYVLGILHIILYIFVFIPLFIFFLPFSIGVKADLDMRKFMNKLVKNNFPYNAFHYMTLSEEEKFKKSKEFEEEVSEEEK